MQRVGYWRLGGVAALLGGGLAGAAILLAVGSAAAPPGAAPADPTVPAGQAAFFERTIRPLLAAKCFSCHAGAEAALQGGLRLDTRDGLLRGGRKGPVVVPGDPDRSLLLQAVTHTNPAIRMPPGGKLRETEVAELRAWVKQGASWPAAARPGTDGHFWAWIPPRPPVLPAVKNGRWVRDPLDRFILAGLEARKLAPAPEADRRTLIRRATFDLTGLPPTPEEVEAFVRDPAPEAYAALIDRLLASPAYGEGWGRHWLDVARYADSNGVDENLVYANAWRYRDYVVRAFNEDRPIDRFIQEQIAGDLLPPTDDGDRERDRVIATGYLSLGPKMLAEDDPVKQEEDILDEQIDTLGKTFMGLTLGCARCHDHKFDPFPQTDYYALAGIFKSTRTMLNFKNMAEWQEVPLVGAAERERQAQAERELAAARARRDTLRREGTVAVLATESRRSPAYRAAARRLLDAPSAPPLRALLEAPGAVPVGGVLLEAEDFVRGNVLKDRGSFGQGIGVLVNAGKYPNFTEYELTLPQAGPYQLDLRYASGDPRPFRLLLNGRLVAASAGSGVTGGFHPEHQRWLPEGVFALPAGPLRIRLERDSYFPHVDKLLLTPFAGEHYPMTPEQVAADGGLVPELLAQAVEQVREGATEVRFTERNGLERAFPEESRRTLAEAEARVMALEKERPMLPRAMAVSEAAPATMRVRLRGNYLTLGDDCPRGVPGVLAGSGQPKMPANASGRLELARWLTAPEHPLTARVFVNRVWRWHFGRGIVPSVDNFGTLGDKPSNQPLLDWLATTFVKDRWSLKRLHRRLMLSATYRMSGRYDARAAAVDPDNRYHWRFSRRRLEAEAVRDALLAVGGPLDRTLGGTLLTFKDRQYVTSTANADPINYRSNRRSIYLPVIRSALYDVYTAFDFGDPTVMNGDRTTTTVAPQALFITNSSVVQEQTRALARRLLATVSEDSGRVQLAYRLCFGRAASEAEVRRALDLVRRAEESPSLAADPPEPRRERAWQTLCRALVAMNEFLYVE